MLHAQDADAPAQFVPYRVGQATHHTDVDRFYPSNHYRYALHLGGIPDQDINLVQAPFFGLPGRRFPEGSVLLEQLLRLID